jgi:Reverse transcriptase (RNA-dependent DNA polymerase)
LIEPPQGVRPIENKWIFKRKINMDDNMTMYKAQMVAKGFCQIERVDYDETFSSVVVFKLIQILLAIVIFHDHEI